MHPHDCRPVFCGEDYHDTLYGKTLISRSLYPKKHNYLAQNHWIRPLYQKKNTIKATNIDKKIVKKPVHRIAFWSVFWRKFRLKSKKHSYFL